MHHSLPPGEVEQTGELLACVANLPPQGCTVICIFRAAFKNYTAKEGLPEFLHAYIITNKWGFSTQHRTLNYQVVFVEALKLSQNEGFQWKLTFFEPDRELARGLKTRWLVFLGRGAFIHWSLVRGCWWLCVHSILSIPLCGSSAVILNLFLGQNDL